MATTIEVLARLRADASQFVRGMKDAEGSVRKFEGSLDQSSKKAGSAFATIGRGATVLGGALGAAAGAAGGYGLKIAMANEQAQISFETMLGSAEKSGAFLKELQQFAATTPFEFPELRTAASRLLAVGTEADKVIPLMTAIGDSTAAMGTGAEGVNRAVYALQQMQQKGKVAGQEMMQLAEAGIPAYDALAASIGKTVPETQKLASEGKISVQQLMDSIENYSGPAMGRVKGMMEAQSQTLTGMLSTLKDTIGLQLGDFMAPVVSGIKEQLPAFTEAIGNTLNALGPSIQKMMDALIPAISSLLPILEPLVGGVAVLLADALTAMAPVLTAVGKALGQLSPVFDDLGVVVVALIEAFLPLLQAVLPALIPLITLTAGALAWVAQTFLQNETFVKMLIPVVLALVAAFAGLPLAIAAAVTAVVYIAQHLGGVGKVIASVAGAIKGAFVTALNFLKNVVGSVIGWISDNWRNLLKVMLLFMGPLGVIINAVIRWRDQIGKYVGMVLNFFKAIPGKIGGFFSGLGESILAPFKFAFNEIAKFWNNTVGKISFKAPSWVPLIGGKGWDIPNIPLLAKGGIVRKPTLSVIGEKGPEAVVPLKKYDQMGKYTQQQKGRALANTGYYKSGQYAKGKQPQIMGPYNPAQIKAAKDYVDKKQQGPLSPLMAQLVEGYKKQGKTGIYGDPKAKGTGTGAGKGGASEKAAKEAARAKKIIERAQEKMQGLVDTAENALSTIKDQAKNLQTGISDTVKSTYSFGSAWDVVQGKIEEAKSNLQGAKDAMKQYRDGVAQALTQNFSFTASLDAARGSGKGFMKQLRKNAEEAKNFSLLIRQLSAAGLDQGALDQIIQAGAKSGTTMAKALLNGGASTIADANTLYKEVQKSADDTASLTSAKFFQAGVDSAQSILDGLNKNLTTNLVAQLQTQANNATTFSTRVKELIAAGFSEGQIQQVLSAGADAGTKIADALLAGGAGTLSETTRLATAVSDAAKTASDAGYDKFYAAGVRAAQAYYDGMLKQQTALGTKIEGLGESPTIQQAQSIVESVAAAPAAVNRDSVIADFLKQKNDQFDTKPSWKSLNDYFSAKGKTNKPLPKDDKNRRSVWTDFAKAAGVPAFGTGAYVRKPTFALIGEKGPEVVAPVGAMRGAIPRPSARGGSGNVTNHITIHVQSNDPNRVVDAIRKYVNTSGGADRILSSP